VLGIGAMIGIFSTFATMYQTFEPILPPQYAKWLPVLMLAAFTIALWAMATTPVATNEVLYREYMRLRGDLGDHKDELTDLNAAIGSLASRVAAPRRLTDTEAKRITAQATSGLRKHIENLPKAFARAATIQRIKMAVISVGEDSETLNYRNDFVKAFEAAGFNVITQVWPAGARESESFAGHITLVQETYPSATHPNGILPIVAASLSAAGVSYNQTASMEEHSETFPGTQYPGAFLVIGRQT
jgi:hypothetical protein